MTIRNILGYGDFFVTCFWGLKSQARPPRSVLRQQPFATGLTTLCRLVPGMASATGI